MTRTEFSSKVRKEAEKRAGGMCAMCRLPIEGRGEFDHIIPWALTRDSSLENCQVICRKCHMRKTGKSDVPRIRKADRQRDKASGAYKRKTRGFTQWRKFDGTIVERKT